MQQLFPGNSAKNACWYFLSHNQRRLVSVSVGSTWEYRQVRKNPQVHGNTVAAFHLRSIPKGIESKERCLLPSILEERSKDTTL
jgi:hypothetical protein